jgi:predicted small secreted protein
MRRTHLAIAAVVLAMTFLTAGCGSDGDGSDVASAKDGKASATPSLDPDELGMKFAQCLREHGIDVDDPEPGKGVALDIKPGTSKSTVDKAMEACRAYDPAELAPKKVNPKGQEDGLKYSACMRKNGVEDFPDPVNGGLSLDGSVMEDPDFKKADEACKGLMGGGGELHTEGKG